MRRSGRVLTLGAWLGAALPLLAGCGKHMVRFEVADLINASGDETTRRPLDVDILCLSGEQVRNFEGMINGSTRSDDWFKGRDADDPKFTNIKREQLYALRGGDADARDIKQDTYVGPALLSGRDSNSPYVDVEINPKGASAIVIYGRFREGPQLARTPPVVIQPVPGPGNTMLVKVGKMAMSYAGTTKK